LEPVYFEAAEKLSLIELRVVCSKKHAQ